MVDDVQPSVLAARLKSDPEKLLLLDVRENWEREFAMIDPSVHIPMDEIPGRVSELPSDRLIVVYCHGGTRSAMVASFFEHHGLRSVANLAGGIEAWSIEVDPTVRRYQ